MSNNQQPDFLPEIRFGKIGVLKVHLISDEELTRLEHGAGQSLFLNIGIGVLSIAISFLISLLTTPIPSNRIFTVFVIITVVGLLAGIVLMILWLYTRKPICQLANEIRDRLPPEGEAQQFTQPYSEKRMDVPSAVGAKLK